MVSMGRIKIPEGQNMGTELNLRIIQQKLVTETTNIEICELFDWISNIGFMIAFYDSPSTDHGSA